MGDGPDAAEKAHFLEVCYWSMSVERAFWWRSEAIPSWSMGRMRSTTLGGCRRPSRLSTRLTWRCGRCLLYRGTSEMSRLHAVGRYSEIQRRVQANLEFLRMMPNPEVCGADLGPEAWKMVCTVPQGHRVASRNSSKDRGS